jgi:hypothetical protein
MSIGGEGGNLSGDCSSLNSADGMDVVKVVGGEGMMATTLPLGITGNLE